tara:strand:+ start:326 stop:811 length:486 start_codon:yes stop_codon:yes gene_type:complete
MLLNIICRILSCILCLFITYKLVQWIFKRGNGFSVGGFKPTSTKPDCPDGTEYDEEFKYCKEIYEPQGNYNLHIQELVTALDKTREKETKTEVKMEPQYLNRRDLYANLCPSVYNKKQLKLQYTTPRNNQLPGYTQYGIFDSIRKIPYPKNPIPMNFEFKI